MDTGDFLLLLVDGIIFFATGFAIAVLLVWFYARGRTELSLPMRWLAFFVLTPAAISVGAVLWMMALGTHLTIDFLEMGLGAALGASWIFRAIRREASDQPTR